MGINLIPGVFVVIDAGGTHHDHNMMVLEIAVTVVVAF
jgi:hypothetical protein